MSAYFVPLISRPTIVDMPGEYLTRAGERVVIETVTTKLAGFCSGHYSDSGITEQWHKTGRILATSETPNDIVIRAPKQDQA